MTCDYPWLTRVESAALCGYGDRNFDKEIRPLLPAAGQRGKGRTLRYHAPAVVQALLAYRAKPAAKDEDGDPLMFGGSESPNLERYRHHRANMVALDEDERRRLIVQSDVIRRALMLGVAAMRGAGDRLVRQYGNGAGEVYNEGVAEFEAAAIEVVKGREP